MEPGSTSTPPEEDLTAAKFPEVPGQAELEAYLSVPVTNVEEWTRDTCPSCNGKRKFYCYDCMRWAGVPTGTEPPRLKLPIKIECILADHRKKATGIHASVLCSDTVTVHEYPNVPDFDPATSLAVFPSSTAVTLEEVEDLDKIERLILVDSRWNNTSKVLELPAVQRLRKVKLKAPPVFSRFWRYHSEGVGHISSIEALYYIVREYEAATGRLTEGSPLTDLLYIFRIQLRVIEDAYDTHPNRDDRPRPTQAAGKMRRLERHCPGSKKLKTFKTQLKQLGVREGEWPAEVSGGEGAGQEGGKGGDEREGDRAEAKDVVEEGKDEGQQAIALS